MMWGTWIFTAKDGRKHVVANGKTWHAAREEAATALGVPPADLQFKHEDTPKPEPETCDHCNLPAPGGECPVCPPKRVKIEHVLEPAPLFIAKPAPKAGLVTVFAPCGCECHVESPKGLNAPTLAVVDMCARHFRKYRRRRTKKGVK